MAWRYRLLVIALVLVSGGLFGLYQYLTPPPVPETPLVSVAPDEAAVAFNVVVLAHDGDEKSFMFCEAERCELKEPPPSLDGEAVTDGTFWWRYVEAESANSKLVKRILEQSEVESGGSKQIIERTPLTSPRGLHISPSGKQLAFWLDNIDRPDDQLTELWFYDQLSGGVRLLVEKIYVPDLHTRLRWNRASSHLWFVADVGQQKEETEVLQFITVSTQPPRAQARFLNLDWEELKAVADHGIMDINQTANRLAYVVPTLFGSSELVVAADAGASNATTVKGTVVFVQWLEDDEILYVVQDRQGFSFWRTQGTVHRFVARRPGTFISAHSDGPGAYIVFAAKETSGPAGLFVLTHDQGRVRSLGQLPDVPGTLQIVHVQREELAQPEIAEVTQTLEDAELAAFLEQHGPAIARQTIITPLRLLATEQTNTVYFDYRTPQGREERVLVIVRDAILAEWSVKARYVATNAEWRKVQGGGLQDPSPTRLYEWESQVKQWILKEEY